MTLEQFLIPIIAAIPPTIAAIAALRAAIRNGQKTEAIHLQINSRMDQFMELIKTSAYDQGVKSETDKLLPQPPEDPANLKFINPS